MYGRRGYFLWDRVGRSTEYTEWQRPLSGVHSIMMEKLAQAGEAGRCMPILLHSVSHHVQSCGVLSSWEGRYPPISTLPLCGVGACMMDIHVHAGLILQEFWHISKLTMTVLFSGFENFWCFHFLRFMLSTVNNRCVIIFAVSRFSVCITYLNCLIIIIRNILNTSQILCMHW
jgi:hypothetical protein